MNVSKKELQQSMRRYPGAKWDKSPLNMRVYEAEFGTLGGKPLWRADRRLLFRPRHRRCGAAARHLEGGGGGAPFLSAAAPECWAWTAGPSWRPARPVGNLRHPDYAAWNGLRDSENSRYVALVAPRVLSREPYGQNSNSVVEEFNFEEETDGHEGKEICLDERRPCDGREHQPRAA